MKIREAIETVDRLMPNQYENPDKIRWLSELDGIVYRDTICTHEHEKEPEAFTGYDESVSSTAFCVTSPPSSTVFCSSSASWCAFVPSSCAMP